MGQNNYSKLSTDELDFVDDKTAALLLNTPSSARLMLWVMMFFSLPLLDGPLGQK